MIPVCRCQRISGSFTKTDDDHRPAIAGRAAGKLPVVIRSLVLQASAKRRKTSGDPSAVDPPVPIPNTEVKRCSPNGSASLGCARVGHRQNKMPGRTKRSAGFFVVLKLSPVLLSRGAAEGRIAARESSGLGSREMDGGRQAEAPKG